MSVKEDIELLKSNSLLRSNDEIEKFEHAINSILDNEDYRNIKDLCLGLNDKTNNEEVMFGLVHSIESFFGHIDITEYFKEFLIGCFAVFENAKEWIKIMLMRIINSQEALDAFIEVSKGISESNKFLLKGLMVEIKEEDSERFSSKVDLYMSSIS